jgi:hypothetical protein
MADIRLAYENADITKLVEDLCTEALNVATEESFAITAVIQGVQFEVHELQKALNTFFADQMHLHRVCSIYANAESYVLAFRCADVHEVMGFM